MSRPELKTDRDMLPGLAAIAFFVVLAAAFLTAEAPEPVTGSVGFGADAAIMKSLGAAMFGFEASQIVSEGTPVPSEGFLAAFIVIAVVLDAALDGSVMLAKREETGEEVTTGAPAGTTEYDTTVADGGEPTGSERTADPRSDRGTPGGEDE